MTLSHFHLSRNCTGYDEYHGFIIAAPTAEEARKMAANASADEGRDVWLHIGLSTCERIGTATSEQPIIVLAAFRAG